MYFVVFLFSAIIFSKGLAGGGSCSMQILEGFSGGIVVAGRHCDEWREDIS